MAAHADETQRVYEVPPGAAPPDLAGLTGLTQIADAVPLAGEQLEDVYYDTGDLRLLHAGVTLRRRTGGAGRGWRLRLPDAKGGPRDVALPPGRAGQPVPADLLALVRVHSRRETLRPVARITIRRQAMVLQDPAGEPLAGLLADDVSAQTMGESTTVTHWRTARAELTGGSRELLTAADLALRQAGLRPAAPRGKLERLLGIAPPALPDPRRLGSSSPAGDVVLAYLREQITTLKALDPLVRRDEPDSVHQMRVCTRRLRAVLRSFRQVVSGEATAELAATLRWLGHKLGAARDGEVLAGRMLTALRATPPELVLGPALARVEAHFAPVRAAARDELLAVLDSPRYFGLLDDLDRLLAEPPLGQRAAEPAARVLPAAVARVWRQATRRMRRARRLPPGRDRDRALHEARKSARRARYAAEASIPVAGRKARRFARMMRTIQNVLGDHQDSVISRQLARELAISAHLAGENAFTFGLLYGHDAERAEDLQAEAWRVWQQASRRRYQRWLG